MKTIIIKNIEAEPLQVIPADEIGKTILENYVRGNLEPWAWVSTGPGKGHFVYSEAEAMAHDPAAVTDITVDNGDLREYTFRTGGLLIDVEAHTAAEAIETINLHDFNEPIPAPGDLKRIVIDLPFKKFGIEHLTYVYDARKGEIDLDLVKAAWNACNS
jgi:hypothetical protein